ncbi:hypothetical protein ES288_D11G107700v1 [Gossypium darwinii]|uniref:Uncharacterized protein n=1 Tax=Gossypium darwinii TaxID=34276 RepID=A0A5D2AL46_GOSDA|nr:hypothetical protein ES288_D11G107700v1 [Gossypium darwinii]
MLASRKLVHRNADETCMVKSTYRFFRYFICFYVLPPSVCQKTVRGLIHHRTFITGSLQIVVGHCLYVTIPGCEICASTSLLSLSLCDIHKLMVDLYLLPQTEFPTGGLYFKNQTWVQQRANQGKERYNS